MTVITTPRLSLVPMSEAAMPDLIRLWQDEEFTRFITGRALSEEEVWLRCLRDIGQWQVKGHGNWAIRETATGAFVGTVGILDYRRTIDPPMTDPELGWGLAPGFQGQGMATEAVSAALDWADRTLKASRTLCMIAPDNQASVRLAHRLGYGVWTTTLYKEAEVTLYERSCRA